MESKLKQEIINSLNNIKKETNKRNVLYENGVDLSNYDNLYLSSLISLLEVLLNDDTESESPMITWWIYESVNKFIYNSDSTIIDLTTAENFVEYMINNFKHGN